MDQICARIQSESDPFSWILIGIFDPYIQIQPESVRPLIKKLDIDISQSNPIFNPIQSDTHIHFDDPLYARIWIGISDPYIQIRLESIRPLIKISDMDISQSNPVFIPIRSNVHIHFDDPLYDLIHIRPNNFLVNGSGLTLIQSIDRPRGTCSKASD